MGLRIATNTQALSAQRSLQTNRSMLQASFEKMSSGARITRAADDAAGLGIAEKMRAQIRSVRQDIRNANDGISMIQTAEGGMNEIGNILVRLRELSVQAASDTVSDTERGFVNKEVDQLREEIDRISQSTEFNGKKLLNSNEGVLEIQVGVNSNPEDRFNLDVSKALTTTEHLGLSDINTINKESAQDNLARLDNAINLLSGNRAELGALQNRLQSSISNLQIYDENLTGARSRIYDADMATETAEMTKNQILSTAGAAILSQANQNSTLALKLIG